MWFDSERLSHAYITEPAAAGMIAMATVCDERTGKRPCNNCNHCNKAARNIHPDITIIGKQDDKSIITVDQIRDLKKDVYVVPNDSMQKAYIVQDADTMNINAQNAFLRILEEPPEHAVFILSTETPASLLPTVRSRCIELKPQPASQPYINTTNNKNSEEEIDENEGLKELIEEFLLALNDNVKLMQCMFTLEKLDRHTFSQFLTQTREQIIQTLKQNQTANTQTPQIPNKILITTETAILKAKEMQTLNVTPAHISGYICATLVK